MRGSAGTGEPASAEISERTPASKGRASSMRGDGGVCGTLGIGRGAGGLGAPTRGTGLGGDASAAGDGTDWTVGVSGMGAAASLGDAP